MGHTFNSALPNVQRVLLVWGGGGCIAILILSNYNTWLGLFGRRLVLTGLTHHSHFLLSPTALTQPGSERCWDFGSGCVCSGVFNVFPGKAKELLQHNPTDSAVQVLLPYCSGVSVCPLLGDISSLQGGSPLTSAPPAPRPGRERGIGVCQMRGRQLPPIPFYSELL